MAIRLEQLHNTVFGTDLTLIRSKEIALRNLDNIKVEDYLNMYKKFRNNKTLAIEHVYENTSIGSGTIEKETIYNLTPIKGISLDISSYLNGFTFSTILRHQNTSGYIFLDVCGVGKKPLKLNNGTDEFSAGFITEDSGYIFIYDEEDDCFRIISSTNGSGNGSSSGSINIQTEQPHSFNNFDIVSFDTKDKLWKLADLNNDAYADGIVEVINENTFRVITDGIVTIPDNITDDENKELVDGEYYFVSKEVNGKLHRNRYLGLEQTALKIIKSGETKSAILMFSSEINYNLYDETTYSLVGGEGIANIERLEKVEETAFENKQEIVKLKTEIQTINEELNKIKETLYGEVIEAIYTEVTNTNPEITFTPVCYRNTNVGETSGEWIPTDLQVDIKADAVALRVNPNTIRLYNSGLVDIPEGILDDGITIGEDNLPLLEINQQELVDGYYYYLSQNTSGKLHKGEYKVGVNQCILKVVTKDSTKKALILINTNTINENTIKDNFNDINNKYTTLKENFVLEMDNSEILPDTDYKFTPVIYKDNKWNVPDLALNEKADGIAFTISDKIFVANNGIFDLPDDVQDENLSEFVEGITYYISNSSKGKFTTVIPDNNIQKAFKVITDNGIKKILILLNTFTTEEKVTEIENKITDILSRLTVLEGSN